MEPQVAQSVEAALVAQRLGEHCRKMKALQQRVEQVRGQVQEVENWLQTRDALQIATQFSGKPYVDTAGTRFCNVLEREAMAVVKSSYFEKQFREQKPYQDRASIDPAFFFSGEEVLKNWQKYGARFLMIVSYSWLSREHPDPELFHLKRLCKMLEFWSSLQTRYFDNFTSSNS